jgi:site-specific recombinase XerD
MANHNPINERIKRQYFAYLKEAKSHSDPTVDGVAKALNRFEVYTKFRDFKAFHFEQAVAFKKHLAEQRGQRSGEKLSKATLYDTLGCLKRFFQWLASQPGYRSRLKYSDAEYFNLSEKDARIATARRERPVPTLEQVKHVIATMPAHSEIEKRDRALVAFTLLTGARDSAIASTNLKHIDVAGRRFYQDAREVRTKNSKTFMTFFFPVGDEIRDIVSEWVTYLREVKLWGNDDPLFPATKVALGASHQFEVVGLCREHWSSAAPIRAIFREAFGAAGLPYFNPHSLRKTLVLLGLTVCRGPEDLKVWSQNLGHEAVLTTLRNYGDVSEQRQGEVLRSMAIAGPAGSSGVDDLAEAFLRRLHELEKAS